MSGRAMMVRASAVAVTAMAFGCVGEVGPVACAIDADCGPMAFCFAGSCYQGTRTCPLLQPSFSSINQSSFQVGCGVKQRNCHAANSEVVSSGPSFVVDVYHTLVNVPAANRLGSVRGLVLVKPGDPDHSFLMIKLRLTESNNPQFGSGKPASAPGACPPTLSVIEQWIQQGAPND